MRGSCSSLMALPVLSPSGMPPPIPNGSRALVLVDSHAYYVREDDYPGACRQTPLIATLPW